MTIKPGQGALWDYLSEHPEISSRLIELGESCDGAERLIDGCPVCGHHHDWNKAGNKIPDWLVGYSTSWIRQVFRIDAGAWVIRCERCGIKSCSHVHKTYYLEKFLEDPRWPKA